METRRHFVSYIAVAAFILVYEYCDARPPTDSLYGDYLYSGAIHPISGAVPKKIHSHEKSHRPHKSKNETSTTGNTNPTMDSLYGNTPSTMDSMKGNTASTVDSMKGNNQSTMDSMKGSANSMMDSLYGDHVYSGSIHPISGAIPKKLPRKNKTKEKRKAKKAKKIFDKMGIDLNQINSSQIDATHKFDGKDSLQPSLCDDTYNDRYGVGKHFVRGARDVAFALASGVEGLVDNLLPDIPLVPNITFGVGGGLKAIICAIENGFSDIAGDLDSGLDIAKNGLVDLFKLKGPHPVLDIPVGIAGIARETVKGAGQLVGDAVGGVKNAVGEVLDAL